MTRLAGVIVKPLIRFSDSNEDFWIWLGKINKNTGYGQKQYCGRTELAHRWVFQMFNGYVPKHMVLNHKCSNPSCVNPMHLEVVTQSDNCRHGKGTKLDIEKVREIKLLLKSMKWGGRQAIADRFKVSAGLISDIKNGKVWADVE